MHTALLPHSNRKFLHVRYVLQTHPTADHSKGSGSLGSGREKTLGLEFMGIYQNKEGENNPRFRFMSCITRTERVRKSLGLGFMGCITRTKRERKTLGLGFMGCITRTERENSWEAETVDQTASKLSRELQQTATGKLALRPNIVNKSTKVPCHSQKLFSSARKGYSHPIALLHLAFRLC
jgi:hypothetical protein